MSQGLPFLLLTGTEMPNKLTSLKVFGRQVPKCTNLLTSYQAEELIKKELKRDGCAYGRERPVKVVMATSLIPGCRLPRADVRATYQHLGVPRGGLKPSQALPAELVQAASTPGSTLF